MKAGYKIKNWVSNGDKVIIVSNYEFENEVYNYGFIDVNSCTLTKSDIGLWKIKQLK